MNIGLNIIIMYKDTECRDINTDTESEMISFAPTDTESEVSVAHLESVLETDEEAFANPFANRSTKIVIEKPKTLTHEERNALPFQVGRS